ncbi:MAG: hypothetical protein ACRDFR_06515 [Candidatus Limnocylindria bacterium]
MLSRSWPDHRLDSGMRYHSTAPALHRATWAAALRDRSSDPARQRASLEPLPAEELPYSRSAERFIDWSPGPETDRLTLELLVLGLEALTDQPKTGPAAGVRSSASRLAGH